MDDLDHSMHMAEFDWSSFCDVSEECDLLKVALARPDNLSDTESEEAENSSVAFSAGQEETRQSPGVSCDVRESRESDGERQEVTSVTLVDPDCTSGNFLWQSDGITNALQTDALHVRRSRASASQKEEDEDVPGECEDTKLNVNEPLAADGAMSEDVRDVKGEKERWFVTVDYSPVRPRVRGLAVKKKQRLKRAFKTKQVCETSPEDDELSESNQDSTQTLERHHSFSDLSQMSCEGDDALENQFYPCEENFPDEMMDRNMPATSSSAATLSPKPSSRALSAEPEESSCVDCYDSDNYLSAAESVEETQHLLQEKDAPADSRDFQSSVSQQTAITDTPQDSSLSCDVTPANCVSYNCPSVDPAVTFLSPDQRADKMPDDTCTCDVNSCSSGLHGLPDTPGDKSDLSASGSSSEDQLGPAPDLTVTPCSVGDITEVATTRSQTVFAISAFWDEMEKLTINDILHLRMNSSTPTGEKRDTSTANANDSTVDTANSTPSEGDFAEMSDTADSDYFTQVDESKPDRSSCEFSTSDFEDEYWQFMSTSRNPSPDMHDINQGGTTDSSYLSHEEEEEEEEESVSSDGKETPVPFEDIAWHSFEESHSWSKPLSTRRMTKSKSMHNVRVLNQEVFTQSCNDDRSGPFLKRLRSMEETVVLEASDSLETLTTAAPCISSYDTDLLDGHFPDVYEHYFPEESGKNDSWCFSNLDELSVVPVLDNTVCTPMYFLLNSLYCQDKPMPIFSCPPTTRETAFLPGYNLLRTDMEEMDNFSPIGVPLSHFLMKKSQCGTGGFHRWSSLLSVRKRTLHFCSTGSMWPFPVDAENVERKDPATAVVTEGKVSVASFPVARERAARQNMRESPGTTMSLTRQEGVFSTLKQADMCLVCIAFASWVLRSSDPENADAWKAALLANVSALSAIQYLRRYVKKRRPQQGP